MSLSRIKCRTTITILIVLAMMEVDLNTELEYNKLIMSHNLTKF